MITMTTTLNKQDIIKSCLEGIAFADEGTPTHFVVCFAYTEHEQILTEELTSLDKAVDEFIELVSNHTKIEEDDEGYSIDAFFEETECLSTIHYHEIQPCVEDR